MGINQQPAGAILTALTFNQAPVVVSYLTTGSVSNSNAEVVIGTFTIPAGDPTFPGGYWFEIFGTAAAVSSPTITPRVRLNGLAGTLLYALGATASAATSTFGFSGKLGFGAIGSSGNFISNVIADVGMTGAAVVTGGLNSAATSINTTISNTIVLTAQFSVANAGNVCTAVSGAMYRL